MVLPANSAAISFSDINVELGANSTAPRDLNDPAVRWLAPGSGHSINTTSTSTISMSDLSTGYFRDAFCYSSVSLANTHIRTISNADSNGNFYILHGSGAVSKINPQTRAVYSSYQYSTNGIFQDLKGSKIVQDTNGDYYINSNFYYSDKSYSYQTPFITGFYANGSIKWQGTNYYTRSTYGIGYDGGSDSYMSSIFNGTNILGAGEYGMGYYTDGSLGGAVFNNITLSNGYSYAVQLNITGFGSNSALTVCAAHNDYAVVGGMLSSNSNYAGMNNIFIAQYTTSNTISWGKRVSASVPASGYSPILSLKIDSGNNIIFSVGVSGAHVLCKANSTGGHVWTRSFPTGGNYRAAHTAIDESDNIYLLTQHAANSTISESIGISALYANGVSIWNRLIGAVANTANVRSGSWTFKLDSTRLSVTKTKLYVAGHLSNSTGTYTGQFILDKSGPNTGTFGGIKISSYTPTITNSTTTYTSLTISTSANTSTVNASSYGGISLIGAYSPTLYSGQDNIT